MIKQIQIIENSDRFHVCVNSTPHSTTLLFEHYKSKQIAYMEACRRAWHLAIEFQEDGFEIKLLPKEIK